MLYHHLVVNMKIAMLTCGTQATLGEGAVGHLKSVAKLDLVHGAKLSVQHNISVKNDFFFLLFTFFFCKRFTIFAEKIVDKMRYCVAGSCSHEPKEQGVARNLQPHRATYWLGSATTCVLLAPSGTFLHNSQATQKYTSK